MNPLERVKFKKIESLMDKGQKFFGRGYFRNAKACFQEISKIDPYHSEALNAYASALYEINYQEWNEEAVECLIKAVRIEPQNAKAWNNIGNYHYVAGDYELAIKYLEKSISITPKNSTLYVNLALAFRNVNWFQEAFTEIGKAIKLSPDCAWTRFQLGLTFLFRGLQREDMKDLIKAKEVFKKVLQMKIPVSETNVPSWVMMLGQLVNMKLDFCELRKFLTQQIPDHIPYLGGEVRKSRFSSLVH